MLQSARRGLSDSETATCSRPAGATAGFTLVASLASHLRLEGVHDEVNEAMRYTSSKIAGVLVLALVLMAGTSALADSQTYTDVNSWLARSTALTTVNFAGMAPAGGYSMQGSNGSWTSNGATFSTPGLSFIVDQNFNPAVYGTNWNGNIYQIGPPSSTTTVTFASSTSFSILLMNYDSNTNTYGGTVLVTVNGITYSVQTAAAPGGTFFGFTSDTAFNTISFASGGSNVYYLGDFQYGQDPPPVNPDQPTSNVPEPGSLVLLGTGFLTISRFIRRKV
jgi:PEP-CTERM motif